MSLRPLPYVYEGDGRFRALGRHALAVVAETCGQGQVVRLMEQEERSEVSHNHQFAWLHEAWQSLPEHLRDEYPSADALRKWALIQAGFYEEQRIDVGSNAGAIRVAQAIRSMPAETFSAIVVRGPLVVVRRAKSQARGKMDKAEFQASKTGILQVISELLGVEPDALEKAQAA